MKELKASELMLNNYILRNGELFQVDEDTYSDMAYFAREDTFEPMELTEVWLLKFGFEKDHLYFSKDSFHYHMHGIVFIGNDHVSSGHVDSYLKTVHQLQNLYFALTGEELTIKN